MPIGYQPAYISTYLPVLNFFLSNNRFLMCNCKIFKTLKKSKNHWFFAGSFMKTHQFLDSEIFSNPESAVLKKFKEPPNTGIHLWECILPQSSPLGLAQGTPLVTQQEPEKKKKKGKAAHHAVWMDGMWTGNTFSFYLCPLPNHSG